MHRGPFANPSWIVPPKLGILAGTGELPRRLIEACQRDGRSFFVVRFEGENDNGDLADYPGVRVPLGALARTFAALKREQCEEIVLVGKFKRPNLASVKLDLRGAMLLPKLLRAGGDNSLLTVILHELEQEGFRVVGVDQILPPLTAPEGVFGRCRPSAVDEADVAMGLAVLQALSPFDVGQAVVVEGQRVLGIEGPEGTDSLLDRCKSLKARASAGVLVKLKKTGQDGRVDLPTIGPMTIDQVVRCGLAGIAVGATTTLVVDFPAVVQRADELGVFVIGVDPAV
ncbi:MAG: LpxI family protein [Alphaproteobacteria bacterium]|nr:LpxI family protein [Alphaproteobacteria bacterium]